MPEPPARLWLDQANSDWAAASRVLVVSDVSTYCQALAKYQQVVEKTVKAMGAAIAQAGITTIPVGFSHDVEKMISALMHLPRKRDWAKIQSQIKALLNEGCRGEIHALSDLAPKRPAPGDLACRNTEYPYQRHDGSWIAPSETGAFAMTDVDRFRALAYRLITGSSKVVFALKLPVASSR